MPWQSILDNFKIEWMPIVDGIRHGPGPEVIRNVLALLMMLCLILAVALLVLNK